MIILKSKASNLQSPENFLANRGWALQSVSSIKELLMKTIETKPQFVLLPMDFPIAKIREIPQILMQAASVIVIGYVEGTTAASMRQLSTSSLKYVLMPPVTGPAMERIYYKVIKDLQKEKERQSQADPSQSSMDPQASGSNSQTSYSSNSSGKQEGATTIRGNKKSSDESTMNQSFSSGAGGNASYFQSQGEGLGPSADGQISSSEGVEEGGLTPEQILALESEGALFGGSSGKSNQLSASTPSGAIHTKNQSGSADSSKADRPGFNGGDQGRSGQNDRGSAANRKTGAQSAGNMNPNGSSQGSDSETSFQGSMRESRTGGPKGSAQSPTDSSSEMLILKGSEATLESIRVQGKAPGATENVDISPFDSLVEEATQLEEVSERIGEVSNVACLLIESEKYAGYLLAAMGDNRPLESDFLQLIRDRLVAYLKNNGEDISSQDTMDLKVELVPFEDWALEAAEFLRKSVHKDREVALAFFPHATKEVGAAPSKAPDMCAIAIEDIGEEVELDFDAYIYLPSNDKYLLYTRKGNKLYGQQKSRLKDKGVSHIHIFQSEIQNLKKNKVRTFFKDSVETFKKKKAS